jgi:hypothetical protein
MAEEVAALASYFWALIELLMSAAFEFLPIPSLPMGERLRVRGK